MSSGESELTVFWGKGPVVVSVNCPLDPAQSPREDSLNRGLAGSDWPVGMSVKDCHDVGGLSLLWAAPSLDRWSWAVEARK